MNNESPSGIWHKPVINENGHIAVSSPTAYWIPHITLKRKIHGTTYIVTGSFAGIEPLTGKLERIMARSITNKTDDTPEKAEDAHDNSAEV